MGIAGICFEQMMYFKGEDMGITDICFELKIYFQGVPGYAAYRNSEHDKDIPGIFFEQMIEFKGENVVITVYTLGRWIHARENRETYNGWIYFGPQGEQVRRKGYYFKGGLGFCAHRRVLRRWPLEFFKGCRRWGRYFKEFRNG